MILLLYSVLLLKSASAGIFSKTNVLLRSLKVAECQELYNPGVIQFRDVALSTTAEGDLVVSGRFSTAINLTSPIEVKLEFSRRSFGIYIPLPCIMNIGSCTFDDLCKYGLPTNEHCPGALDENDVPCRCPIPEGLYYLPGAQFPLPATRLAYFIAGRYRGTIRIRHKTRMLACYKVHMELQ